jgi:hypothetical protein
MPFNSQTAKLAGQKGKREPSKTLDPNIKEKMEILYEEVLDHLIMHQADLSMSERVKLLQSLSGYILAKTKPIRDQFTIQELIDRESIPFMERGPYPTT